MVTDVDLRVVDLDENLNPWRVLRRPLACLIGLDLVPRRRAWLPTADVHVQCSGDQDLVLLGLILRTARS